jgi:hypothetical protein
VRAGGTRTWRGEKVTIVRSRRHPEPAAATETAEPPSTESTPADAAPQPAAEPAPEPADPGPAAPAEQDREDHRHGDRRAAAAAASAARPARAAARAHQDDEHEDDQRDDQPARETALLAARVGEPRDLAGQLEAEPVRVSLRDRATPSRIPSP